MKARRGTREATTTEVIGEGDGGIGGRVNKRDIVESKTRAGEITLTIRIGSESIVVVAPSIIGIGGRDGKIKRLCKF